MPLATAWRWDLLRPLTNTGTITSEPVAGGARTIRGNLTNQGTLAINQNTAYNLEGALLTNEGTIAIASAVALNVSGPATVTNGTGGQITVTGTGDLHESGGTFNEGLGKTSTAKTANR